MIVTYFRYALEVYISKVRPTGLVSGLPMIKLTWGPNVKVK